MIYPANHDWVLSVTLNTPSDKGPSFQVLWNFAELGMVQAQKTGTESALVAGHVQVTCKCCVGSEDRLG